MLKYKEKQQTERVPFVIQFHPRLRALGRTIHKHFHLLKTNDRLKKSFPDAPMVAFRRLPNLGDRLIHSNTNTTDQEEPILKKCGTPRCQCCQHFKESEKIEINGKTHRYNQGGNCKTENLIYTLKCRKCHLSYIGESKQRLHQRLNGHREAVRKVKKGQKLNDDYIDTGAALHFGQEDHEFQRDVEVQIVEKGSWGTPGERKEKESFWICHFRTGEDGDRTLGYNAGGLNKTKGKFAPLYGQI